METVLVTGGAGFIGSHIVDLLIEKGYQVVVIDNLSTGKKENLDPKAIFYQLDLLNSEIEEIFQTFSISYLCHQAAQANVRISIENPGFDSEVNILGFLKVMELAKKYKIKKVVAASSVAVYGDISILPISESINPRPISPYGVSKLSMEYYLSYYYLVHHIPFVALRYANVYGPRQDSKGEGGVVAIFCDKMFRQELPVINGDGTQTRDFVFVSDVASANLLSLENNSVGIYNIGTGKEISINELFGIIKDATHFQGQEIHGPSIPGDIIKSCLDSRLAYDTLNWKAKTALRDGIKKVLWSFS